MLNFRTLAAALLTLSPLAISAEPLDYQSIIAQNSRATVAFDASFEQQNGRQLDLYFAVSVPILEGAVNVRTKFENGPDLPQVIFATPTGNLAEQVSITTGTIDQGTAEERAANLASVILDQIVPSLGELENFQNLGARHTTIGNFPAVEMIGLYEAPEAGRVFLRIVGVLAPKGDHAFLAISHTVNAYVPLASPNDMPNTFVGTMLESLHFIAGRNESGAMVEF